MNNAMNNDDIEHRPLLVWVAVTGAGRVQMVGSAVEPSVDPAGERYAVVSGPHEYHVACAMMEGANR